MPEKDGKFITNHFIKKWMARTSLQMPFNAKSPAAYRQWQQELKSSIKKLLLDFPEPASLEPEFYGTEVCKKYTREKWLIQTEKDCWMPLYLLIPNERQQPAPAILCCHGHGQFGKDPVAGVHLNHPGRLADISRMNYDYGRQMAEHGFITIVPDWRSFGERIGYENPVPGRDICNIHFLRHLLLGRTLLGANIFDAMRAIDFLITRDEVDNNRIGCMGLSFGGTMTLYTSLFDDRIRAADIICYASTFEHFCFNNPNTCGSQLVPGLARLVDLGHVIGALAPKPLLIEAGICDSCFEFHSARAAQDIAREIYHAAGAAERIQVENHPGEHAFGGQQAFEFFQHYLG